MVGNPYRWRAVISQSENTNSTAGLQRQIIFTGTLLRLVIGFLLAFLLFLPLLSQTFHININVIVLFIVIYVSIIVPIGTGILSMKDVIKKVKKLLLLFYDNRQRKYYMTQLSYLKSWVRYIYFQVEGVQTFTTQMIFSVATEKLLCPSKRFSCLFVLLFFSFVAYAIKSLKKKPWVRLINEKTTFQLIRMTTVFVVCRLGKGVAVSSAMLVFSYHFADFETPFAFFALTFFYFFVTQYQSSSLLKKALVNCLVRLEWQCFDGLEEYWIPVIIHSLAVLMSMMIFAGLFIYTNNYYIIGILGYFNIFLPLKHLLEPVWKALKAEKAIISKYSLATWNNPQIREGYACPICLDKMRVLTARITPCGHVFHGSCLRKCLHHSKQCPMCKAAL